MEHVQQMRQNAILVAVGSDEGGINPLIKVNIHIFQENGIVGTSNSFNFFRDRFGIRRNKIDTVDHSVSEAFERSLETSQHQ